jgi:thiol-disulfide isomerase/thioredoxin
MKVIFFYLTTFVVASMQCFAQNSIQIGQQLPDLEINKILYHKSESTKLSDFRGKLIILDFWSTACSPCIAGMQKMDSLQRYFGSKVAILPVYPASGNRSFGEKFINTVDSFWKANKYLSKTLLPSVLDADFARNFPHRVAYQIWIDGDRRIRAITTEEYVNKTEIQKMLDGSYPDWESEIKDKLDGKFLIDHLFKSEFSELKQENYSFFTKYLKGVESKSETAVDNYQGLVSLKNVPIMSFYDPYLFANKLVFSNVLLEVKDSLRFFRKGYLNEWFRSNSYCYELKLNRKVSNITLAKYVLEDANRYFGLNARIENRTVNCLVLKKIKNSKVSVIKEPSFRLSVPEFYNQIRYELNGLWQKGEKTLPILNETKSKSTTTLTCPLSTDFTNIPALRKVLQSQGYDLVRELRVLKMFVISEIN